MCIRDRESGDRVWVRTPGGGGYGDPLERSAELVLEDVRLGRYSLDQAADLYGVVLTGPDAGDGSGVPVLDKKGTEAKRAEMRAAR